MNIFETNEEISKEACDIIIAKGKKNPTNFGNKGTPACMT